jgi:hypothetical protein
MQTIYEKDVMWCAQKIALRYMARYEREHPELAALSWMDLLELRRKLLRRAFEPKAGVKMVKRLLARGYDIVPGEGPERTTVQRMRARFCEALSRTVEAASARFEAAQCPLS